MQVRQHAQYQGSVTGSLKWNAAIINVIIYTLPSRASAETISQLIDRKFISKTADD